MAVVTEWSGALVGLGVVVLLCRGCMLMMLMAEVSGDFVCSQCEELKS